MNLEKAQEAYDYFTVKASDLVRQLGFAGIALIWIFKGTINGREVVPPDLVPAAKWIAVALSLDLLHYVFGALIWGAYHRFKERQATPKGETFEAPRMINWPTLACFWGKIVAVGLAYARIIPFLAARVLPS
jgi:hypothetical protein